ncbi:PVC-type heme-binding CxxCH protein [Tautonia rosea]|uniref:PVC-type heme-binding CxxCH protein n=1 Tax=Tautonia rosea TaxID=2728037 RepID=UPI001472D9F8|nr:PVC-type heme-binding CxxCH protein [Tautonia rosea]
MTRTWLCLILIGLLNPAVQGRANQPTQEDGPLPRFEPLEPKEAITSFQTTNGDRMELLAAEPMVLDPVAGAFDAQGKLFIAEMADYPHVEQANDQPFQENTGDPPIGRVRLLIDQDGDGCFDESHLFAEGLSWPTGIAPWKGGIFVAATPDLWYLKDTNGDHRADVRERIFTGFRKYNIQAVMNNLIWGLDHRIYGAGSSNGGQIRRAELPEGEAETIPLLRSDYRFDPRVLSFEPISGGARFGNTFDDWGNRFLCNIRNPAQHVVLPDRDLARNPLLPLPSPLHDVAEAGDTIIMHRISPSEPWRELRARRWVEIGKELPRSELVGAGYLTSSSGITSLRGDAFPDSYRGNLILGEVANNLIHRMTVQPMGVTFTANRAEEGVEWVASTDTWFRPVNFVNAPDGSLLVLDMYRETIEHPWSIPDDIRERLNLRSGDDRGRIYRLVPQDFRPRPTPDLSALSTSELVQLLEHPNAWHRETAHRLIFERQDTDAIDLLKARLLRSSSTLGRVHALWSLEGLGALDDALLIAAFEIEHVDANRVREHLVSIAGTRLEHSERLQSFFLHLSDQPDARVRFRQTLALGGINDPAVPAILAQIARRDHNDPWMKSAILASAGAHPIGVFDALLREPWPGDASDLHAILDPLAFAIGAGSSDEEAVAALEALARSSVLEPTATSPISMKLGDGLIRRRSSLFELDVPDEASRMLDQGLARARRAVGDRDLAPEDRALAVMFFAHRPFEETTAWLSPLIGPDHPVEVRLAAVTTLARFGNEPDVAPLLLSGWNTATPTVRAAILSALSARPSWAEALVDAIESNQIAAGQIPQASRSALLKNRNDSIRDRAARFFGRTQGGPDPDILARYLATLETPGNAAQGRAVFDRSCATCHRLGDTGHPVGPNLVSVSRRTPDELLTHILDPNREVAPDAIEYLVALRDGRVTSGLIASESAASLTLLRAGGEQETVLRLDIEELSSTGRSLMPEGLEKEIAPPEMADLIAFLLRLQTL